MRKMPRKPRSPKLRIMDVETYYTLPQDHVREIDEWLQEKGFGAMSVTSVRQTPTGGIDIIGMTHHIDLDNNMEAWFGESIILKRLNYDDFPWESKDDWEIDT